MLGLSAPLPAGIVLTSPWLVIGPVSANAGRPRSRAHPSHRVRRQGGCPARRRPRLADAEARVVDAVPRDVGRHPRVSVRPRDGPCASGDGNATVRPLRLAIPQERVPHPVLRSWRDRVAKEVQRAATVVEADDDDRRSVSGIDRTDRALLTLPTLERVVRRTEIARADQLIRADLERLGGITAYRQDGDRDNPATNHLDYATLLSHTPTSPANNLPLERHHGKDAHRAGRLTET